MKPWVLSELLCNNVAVQHFLFNISYKLGLNTTQTKEILVTVRRRRKCRIIYIDCNNLI